jgi:hypothetical protein
MFTFTQLQRRTAGLLAFGVSLLLGQSAYAAGTAANALVTNNVTVDYQVSSVPQTQLTSSAAFRVDNKIRMSIGITDDTVIPGQIDQVLTYVITNTGNNTQGYALTVANSTVADNFNMNNVRIYVETGGVAGFDPTDTLYTSGSGVNIGDHQPVAARHRRTATLHVMTCSPPHSMPVRML